MSYFKTIKEFKGKIFKEIFVEKYEGPYDEEGDKGFDRIVFKINDTKKYYMHHEDNLYETSVSIESINGDLGDLLNSPFILAEEVIETGDYSEGRYTWTFYKLGTIKGTVTIRWNGESNGYYGEQVDVVDAADYEFMNEGVNNESKM